MECNFQPNHLLNEFSNEFWLSSFEQGLFIGDGDKETSGGYAEYIVKRLLNEFPHAKIEKSKR